MTEPTAKPAPSAVEGIKEASRQLRGSIADELRSGVDHFNDANKNLIKFHGSYQQEDRDARKTRRKEGVGKYYMFMVRCKIPGGRVTADQYLAIDELAGRYANGTLRFTTRQGIQLHGVLMKDLKATIAGINESLLTTLGACGDVERNVMACPAAFDPVRRQLQKLADRIADYFAPRTRAYHEIWLNGNRVSEPAEIDEPIYGKSYLPRKFKTGLGLAYDNCVDIYAQDLGFLASVADGQIVAFDVLVGGGMGMTHGNANTFPFIARHICSIQPDEVLSTAEAVIKLFRDHGNRADRKRARIKYLVHDWGVERFREVLAGYLNRPPAPPQMLRVTDVDLHLGWHAQDDGKWCRGISVENGRVKDDGDFRLRSGLREIVRRVRPNVRITPQQDVLLCDIDAPMRAEVDRLLADHGVAPIERISLVQQFSMACPAIPTCGLAISESERALPEIIDALEADLAALGLEDERISVRMTGCPNGCARPYQSDIGIVGRSGEKFTLFVGGSVTGQRLNFELMDLVPKANIVPILGRLFRVYQSERRPGESFGDYCDRLGQAAVRAKIGASE